MLWRRIKKMCLGCKSLYTFLSSQQLSSIIIIYLTSNSTNGNSQITLNPSFLELNQIYFYKPLNQDYNMVYKMHLIVLSSWSLLRQLPTQIFFQMFLLVEDLRPQSCRLLTLMVLWSDAREGWSREVKLLLEAWNIHLFPTNMIWKQRPWRLW